MDEATATDATFPTSLRVLCFGDSLTAGYTMWGLEHYPYANWLRVELMHLLGSSDIHVDVAGLSGDEVCGQFLPRMESKCAKAASDPYDWIIVMGGTNDLAWSRQPEEIYNGLQTVWRVALDTGANVLALNVLETAMTTPGMVAKRSALNGMIANHKEERLYTLDIWSKIQYHTVDEEERERIWDDGLHLTGEGYKMMGDEVALRLLELFQTCSNPKNQKKEDFQ